MQRLQGDALPPWSCQKNFREVDNNKILDKTRHLAGFSLGVRFWSGSSES